MARARKTEIYKNVYESLSYEDKLVLKTELDYAIKADERAMAKEQQEEDAKKIRDKIKIHDTVKYKFKKEILSGEVIAITVDKIQVMTDGNKRSVPYNKIEMKLK